MLDPKCLFLLVATFGILLVPGFSKKPHILLFLADDLGWSDIGYHNSDIHTPTLDQLAENGVKLENYYVQPICAPSRSQLLTGRYQIHNGLQHMLGMNPVREGLPLEIPTLPDKLKEHNYRTHMVGKWHLGFYKREYWPTMRGFDSFYGLLGGMSDYYTHSQCFPINGIPECGLDFYDNFEPVLDRNGSYATEVYAERVAELVKEHATNHGDKPMFVYVSFQSPHTPLQVPPQYLQHYQHIQNPIRKIFSGMVSALDAAVKTITDSFKENGLWDDTLTIFSTDNGGPELRGGSNGQLKGGKASLWEGGIKAVGFVHGHKISPRVKSTNELIHVSDWFPTLLRVAGCKTRGMDLDGHDVWKTISKGKRSPRKEILLDMDPVVIPRGNESKCQSFDTRIRAGIRIGKWKLLTGNPQSAAFNADVAILGIPLNNPAFQLPDLTVPGEEDKNVWLFNLDEDPTESVDLSYTLPNKVEYMCNRLAWYQSSAVPPLSTPVDPNAAPANNGGLWTNWAD